MKKFTDHKYDRFYHNKHVKPQEVPKLQDRIPTEILLMIRTYITSHRDIECFRLACKSFYIRLPSTPLHLPYPLDIFSSRDERYKPEQARQLERYKFFKLIREPGNIFQDTDQYILCYRCNGFRKPPSDPFPKLYITDTLNEVEQLCEQCTLTVFFTDQRYLKKTMSYDKHVTVEMATYRGADYWVCDRCMLLTSAEEEDTWEMRMPYMHPHGSAQPGSYKGRRWLCVYCHGKICWDVVCGGWPESWGTSGPLVRKSRKKKGKGRQMLREEPEPEPETPREAEDDVVTNTKSNQAPKEKEIHPADCECEDCKESLINEAEKLAERARRDKLTDEEKEYEEAMKAMASVTVEDELAAHEQAVIQTYEAEDERRRQEYLDLLESGCLPSDLEQDEKGEWRVK